MMKKIVISQEVATNEDIADLLRRIAEMIDNGYTRGHYPNWHIEESNEPNSVD